jgi:hypothetical protein
VFLVYEPGLPPSAKKADLQNRPGQ